MDLTRIAVKFIGDATSYMKSLNTVMTATTKMASSVVKDVSKMVSTITGQVTRLGGVMASTMTGPLTKMVTGVTGHLAGLAGKVVSGFASMGTAAIRGVTRVTSSLAGMTGKLGLGGAAMFMAGPPGWLLMGATAIAGIGMALVGLGGTASGVFGELTEGAKHAITTAIELGIEYEKTQASFEVMTGSAKRGQQLLDDIKKLAVASPFESAGLTHAAEMTLGMGVSANDVIPVLARLGDMAGGSENKLRRLALAYGQVMSAGRLRGQELRQFTEVGVGIEDFAKTAGVGTREFKAMMEDSAVSTNVVTRTVNDLTSAGGRFFGMSKRMNDTVGGQWNALKETITIALEKVATSLFKTFDVAGRMGRFTETFSKMFQNGLPGFIAWLDRMTSGFSDLRLLIESFASSAKTAMMDLYETITKAMPTQGGLEVTVEHFSDSFIAAMQAMSAVTIEVIKVMSDAFITFKYVILDNIETMSKWVGNIGLAADVAQRFAIYMALGTGKPKSKDNADQMGTPADRSIRELMKLLEQAQAANKQFFENWKAGLAASREELAKYKKIQEIFSNPKRAPFLPALAQMPGGQVFNAVYQLLHPSNMNRPEALAGRIPEKVERSLDAQNLIEKIHGDMKKELNPFDAFQKEIKTIEDASRMFGRDKNGNDVLMPGRLSPDERKFAMVEAFHNLEKGMGKMAEANAQPPALIKGTAASQDVINQAMHREVMTDQQKQILLLQKAERQRDKANTDRAALLKWLETQVEAIVRKKV